MIELSNLTKSFGDLTAVDDVSLVIPKGEFFAVLGPNAAGKTTTIKMITGLIRPTSGTVKVAVGVLPLHGPDVQDAGGKDSGDRARSDPALQP
jgi:ABC-type multidrug transport system ATPase subunit